MRVTSGRAVFTGLRLSSTGVPADFSAGAGSWHVVAVDCVGFEPLDTVFMPVHVRSCSDAHGENYEADVERNAHCKDKDCVCTDVSRYCSSGSLSEQCTDSSDCLSCPANSQVYNGLGVSAVGQPRDCVPSEAGCALGHNRKQCGQVRTIRITRLFCMRKLNHSLTSGRARQTCFCERGYYAVDAPCAAGSTTNCFACRKCALGADCTGAGLTFSSSAAKPGYWQMKKWFNTTDGFDTDGFEYMRCHEDSACLDLVAKPLADPVQQVQAVREACFCLGVHNYSWAGSGCHVGHMGPLCMTCQQGFVKSSASKFCFSCSSMGNGMDRIVYGVAFCVGGIALITFLFHSRLAALAVHVAAVSVSSFHVLGFVLSDFHKALIPCSRQPRTTHMPSSNASPSPWPLLYCAPLAHTFPLLVANACGFPGPHARCTTNNWNSFTSDTSHSGTTITRGKRWAPQRAGTRLLWRSCL